jgi:ABC-type dipeptide/oligopeptide/nickel transport system ATPase component
VTIQAQIVELVKQLRDEIGMAIIWITHDLGVVAGLADRMMVMYAGFIVEEAPVKEVYANPRHPYTLGLLGSLPRLDEIRANSGCSRSRPAPGPDRPAARVPLPAALRVCRIDAAGRTPLLEPVGPRHNCLLGGRETGRGESK